MMDLTTETADTGEAARATGTLNAVGAALEQVELDSDGEGGQGHHPAHFDGSPGGDQRPGGNSVRCRCAAL